MDLALGLAFAGYHLWTYQRKPGIDITEPYLLNVPPEIRLLVYDLVFAAQGDQEKASDFLRLLLTCRLIYQEAYARAFTHTNFSLRVLPPIKPYWTPQILKLPHAKWSLVRNVTIVWDSPLLEAKYLRPVFTELASLSLNLDQLVIKFKNQYAVAPFQFKYAPLYHGVHDVAKYIMEELPLMDNVKKIIFPNPSIEIKRNYQHLFDPTKPSLRIGGHPGLPLIDSKPKQLGKWKYTVVRVDKLVTTWRLEMTHPTPKAEKASSAKGASVPRKDQDDAIAP